jgi:enoyl-[acyl-carrier protein] reductase II
MFRTEVCDILRIEYPIILGGMLWVGKSDLVAAVSDAGGLGLLGAGGMSRQEVASECDEIRRKTQKPFGVNVPLARPDAEDLIDAAISGGASVISTSSGSPGRFTGMIKDRGCIVMHVAPSVSFAKKCEAAGVDVIVAEGVEAGGHNGRDEITTFVLTQQVASAVKTPVVSAGGIADGKGLVAALALGARGVQMGTRFLASHESAAHPNIKNAVIEAADDGTCITGRTTIGPTRAIKNKLTDTIVQAERKGTDPAELYKLVGEGRSLAACVDGDCEEGTVYCGQIAGAIREIKTVKDIVDELISEAQSIAASVDLLVNGS